MAKKKKNKTRKQRMAQPGWNQKLLMTDQKFMGMIVNMLREHFRNTRRRAFIEESRLPYKGPLPGTFSIQCEECDREMTTGEKVVLKYKTGKREGQTYERSVFDIDHKFGITPLKTFEDIEAFCNDLFHGPLQVLCKECHTEKTEENRLLKLEQEREAKDGKESKK